MKQSVRIIGGQFKGKLLSFPDIKHLRPTPNMVRETLFNWLMHDIRGARCLDAFAGSGALGFEAFSRYAAKVVLLEYEAQAFQNLHKIAASFPSQTLEKQTLTVIKKNALEYFAHSTEQFDIIFLDPPFSSDHLTQCINLIESSHILGAGGVVYIESNQKLNLDSSVWATVKSKTSGNVAYGLYTKKFAEQNKELM